MPMPLVYECTHRGVPRIHDQDRTKAYAVNRVRIRERRHAFWPHAAEEWTLVALIIVSVLVWGVYWYVCAFGGVKWY